MPTILGGLRAIGSVFLFEKGFARLTGGGLRIPTWKSRGGGQ